MFNVGNGKEPSTQETLKPKAKQTKPTKAKPKKK